MACCFLCFLQGTTAAWWPSSTWRVPGVSISCRATCPQFWSLWFHGSRSGWTWTLCREGPPSGSQPCSPSRPRVQVTNKSTPLSTSELLHSIGHAKCQPRIDWLKWRQYLSALVSTCLFIPWALLRCYTKTCSLMTTTWQQEEYSIAFH